MKKRMILMTGILLVIAIGISIYFNTQKQGEQSVAERIPTPSVHKHVLQDGNTIEHIHNYSLPESSSKNTSQDETTPKVTTQKKSPWIQQWEKLDLATIRRNYQPYTVTEMRKLWDWKLLPHKDDPTGPGRIAALAEADRFYPRDAFLERMLELGYPFVNFPHYRNALMERGLLPRKHAEWNSMDVAEKAEYLEKRGLPVDSTWEVLEDHFLKSHVVHNVHFHRAWDTDPSLRGGISIDGVFMPVSQNTVHVHISEDSFFAQFAGVKLTREEKDALKIYGTAPKGINVIYVDKNNEPLSPGTSPSRFYERKMKALVEAQAHLQQQIEYHETMFELESLHSPPEEGKKPSPVPHEHPQNHEHDHGHETPQTPDEKPEQQRRQPDAKRTPPQRKIPPELRKPDAVNQRFKELELLHGGQLPKDLQELRKIITELEKIRKEGEAMMKPPQRPERPVPPLPPEGSSPPPPNEDD